MERVIEILREENEEVAERYELIRERVEQIAGEDVLLSPYKEFFREAAEELVLIYKAADDVYSGMLYKKDLEELKEQNEKLFACIQKENYEESFANPAYAVKKLGKMQGRYISAVFSEILAVIPCAFEYRLFEITAISELFVEIYNCYEDYCRSNEEERADVVREVKEALYYYLHDYCEDFAKHRAREMYDVSYTFARDIIMEADLTDTRYLYWFGTYVTDNEIKISKYLAGMSEAEVRAMAFTYTEGYVRGFKTMGVDFSKKSIVNIRYCLGFERMIRYAIESFENMGKKVTIPRAVLNILNRRYGRQAGFTAVPANLQYDFDHRFDLSLAFNAELKHTMLTAQKLAYETYKIECALLAGPAVLETFGEPYEAPVFKEECAKFNKRQNRMRTELARDISIASTAYINQEETSFTIIAYPLPSIGENFEEIFAGTVKVNTLDNDEFRQIQQHIIDALDKGRYVHVKGAGKNTTDIKVMLYELKNPLKETIFENCTADVNIPVGEVFTSPVLEGTEGTLNVSEVFLNGTAYKNLTLTFKDGKITSYSCDNFEKEEENKKLIEDNILYNHETLPVGEFAIGTNTTAYVMAEKYKIQEKLPILIAEKTGPHFAVGDTCYSRSEDHAVFNPDGKEIVARDNSVSILRKTDMEKAYLNCHTDITIPYNEVGEISVYDEKGNKTEIIVNGRFVLAGTEKLNEPFEAMKG